MDGIELRAFPRGDDLFNRVVMDVTHQLAPDDPLTLEQALRAMYPRVQVMVQSSLAALGAFRVWYVFRDGKVADATPALVR